MSRAPDFTKTSSQIEREITQLIDSIDRSLDSSHGDAEKKGQLVLSAFLSLAVFVAIFGFNYLLHVTHPAGNGNAADNKSDTTFDAGVTARDLSLASTYLDRIDAQSKSIRDIKNRVAPSMPIDSQIDAIQNSAQDTRRVLEIDVVKAP